MPEAGFAHDDGLLNDPELRRSTGRTLAYDQRATAEALLDLRHAAFALDQFTRVLRNRYDIRDIRMVVLVRMHNHGAGVPVADLVADLGEHVVDVLDHIEQAGMLTWVAGQTQAVRPTDAAVEFIDDALRRLAAELTTLTEGVHPAQLAVMRHVCLRLSALASLVSPPGRPSPPPILSMGARPGSSPLRIPAGWRHGARLDPGRSPRESAATRGRPSA